MPPAAANNLYAFEKPDIDVKMASLITQEMLKVCPNGYDGDKKSWMTYKSHLRFQLETCLPNNRGMVVTELFKEITEKVTKNLSYSDVLLHISAKDVIFCARVVIQSLSEGESRALILHDTDIYRDFRKLIWHYSYLHERPEVNNPGVIDRDYANFRLQAEDDPMKGFRTLNELRDAKKAIGGLAPTDYQHCARIVDSLPAFLYESIKAWFALQSQDTISLSSIQGKISNHYEQVVKTKLAGIKKRKKEMEKRAADRKIHRAEGDNDLCSRCHRKGHSKDKCFAKKDANGRIIKSAAPCDPPKRKKKQKKAHQGAEGSAELEGHRPESP
jgi:hypothetical protein